MKAGIEKLRKPVQVEPPDRVGQEFCQGKGPRLAIDEQFFPWQVYDRLRRVAMDEIKLCAADFWVFRWLAIVGEPPDDPGHAEDAGGKKGGAPAETQRNPGDERRGENGSDISAGVEDAGCEGALALRKPFGSGFDRGWEITCFSETEEESCNAEAECGADERMAHGSQAPEAHNEGVADARAELVDHAAG